MLQGGGQRRAVNGRDHEKLDALRDHVLDLRYLVLHYVVAVRQIGRIAHRLELVDHVLAVGDPAL